MSLTNTMKSFQRYNARTNLKREVVEPTLAEQDPRMWGPEPTQYKEEVDKLNKLLNDLKTEKYEVIEALNSEIDNNLNLEKELYKTKKRTKDDIRVNLEKLEDEFKNVSTHQPLVLPKPKRPGRPAKILKDVKIADKK